MPNFSNHQDVLEMLKAAQDADRDNRERAREALLFLNKRDGQWEPYWWNLNSGKPRYTFDMTTPVVDQISGEMAQADFDIKIKPASGDASKDVAKTLDGLVRNIENISNAVHVFNQAARSMVIGGIDGWMVTTDFVDDNSFDQDLLIEKVPNFVDRVWLDPASEEQDRSDATWGVVLHALSRDEYDEKYPEGSGQSISDDRRSEAYFHKADLVIIGQLFYIKQEDRDIVLMSNGKTYEDNEDFQKVKDELEAVGVTEERRRTRKDNKVFSRLFDNSDWLETEKETVFSWIPLIPTYGNFSVFESKILYHGAVEKLLDYQRVYNYAKSREIEEGALAPRAKYWMTEKQMSGFEDTLATLNTNSDPAQGYNNDPEVPGPPQQSGGAAINQGLMAVSQSMQDGIGRAAGLFAANMGESFASQSGVAIKALQDKGNIGTIKYFKAQEVAICHTGRIIVDAIPRVYDASRQVRILGEDGALSMQKINEVVQDQQTGEIVKLNDLSAGKYDVTCSSGPAFQNKQQETVQALLEIAQVDPSVLQTGSDILVNNVTAPGMDALADRQRLQLFNSGVIPQDQWTDEERQQVEEQQAAAQQQPPQEDPNMVLARAEEGKAQADLTNARNKQAEVEGSQQLKARELALEEQRIQLDIAKFQREKDDKFNVDAAKIQQGETKLDQEQQKIDLSAQDQQFNNLMAAMQQQNDQFSQAVNDLKDLREAIGVDTIVGPSNTAAYIKQADKVEDAVDDTPDV